MGGVLGSFSGPSILFGNNLDRYYEVQRVRHGRRIPLGSGTMGEVWPATHKASRKLHVVKSIQKAKVTDPYIIENEIRALKMLQGHHGVVTLYETFEEPERWHLIFEYLPKTLEDILDVEKKNRDEPQILIWVTQMVEAVFYLHYECKIIHRDIKPSNFLVGRNHTLKLADFGVAYLAQSTKKSLLHSWMTTNTSNNSGMGASIANGFGESAASLVANPLQTLAGAAGDYFSVFAGSNDDAEDAELLKQLRESHNRPTQQHESGASEKKKSSGINDENISMNKVAERESSSYQSTEFTRGNIEHSATMTRTPVVPSGVFSTVRNVHAESNLPELKLTEVVGSPAYMAPEQHRLMLKHRNAHYGFKVDVWALGVMAYILFTNKHPFRRRGSQAGEAFSTAGKTIQATLMLEEELEGLDINGELSMLHLYNGEFEWPRIGGPISESPKNFIIACCYPSPSQRWDIGHLKEHEYRY